MALLADICVFSASSDSREWLKRFLSISHSTRAREEITQIDYRVCLIQRAIVTAVPPDGLREERVRERFYIRGSCLQPVFMFWYSNGDIGGVWY